MKRLFIVLAALALHSAVTGQLQVTTPANNDLPSSKILLADQAKLEFYNYFQSFDFLKNQLLTEGGNISNGAEFKKRIIEIEQFALSRLNELGTAAQYTAEWIQLNHILNISKSISCLEERKNDGIFIKQKDYEGQDIVGYPLDSLRGNVRYGLVEAYKEGFARIKKDQVFGFINVCGDEVVPCQYENAEPFNNGRALVKKVFWYYVDGQNNESDQLFNVSEAKALTKGISLATFRDGKQALINNRYDITKKPISAYYDDIKPFFGKEIFKVKIGNQFGLINLEGKVELDIKYTFIEPSGVSHLYRIGQNGKVGLMDTLWKIKFEPIFTQISDFDAATNLAVAQTSAGFQLLSNQTFKISPTYKSISPFNKLGLALIQSESNMNGLIDKNLNIIVEPKYLTIGEYNELSLAPVSRSDKKFGFINEKGEEVLTPQFDEVGKFHKFGVVVVKEFGKDEKGKNVKTDMLYDKNGRAILTKQNDTLGGILRVEYEILDTLLNDRFIIVKRKIDGNFVGQHLVEIGAFRPVTANPYTMITPFDANNIFRVKTGNLWGMMDTSGRVVLLPTYKEIQPQSEGYYAVKNETDKFGFIDKKAKIQIPFDYEEVKTYRNGHCVVTKGKEKWGLINKFNAKIVPLYFKAVVENGNQYEMIDEKGNKYIINDKGDCVENCPKFEEIRKKANTK